jgi:hypothetical protein
MKSYVKIYGPPVSKAIKELEKIALDMPEVCIMSTPITVSMGYPGPGASPAGLSTMEGIMNYFDGGISEERCDTIISKSGESLGEYDFYFEWFKPPKMDDVVMLIDKIDELLQKVGVHYTITTK